MRENERMMARGLTLAGALLVVGWMATAPAVAYEAALDEAAQSLMQRFEKKGVKSVAVVAFTDLRGRETELGRFLAEELSTALGRVESPVQLVDRLRLAQVLDEAELSVSGVLPPEAAREVGRISGVEVLVTGRMTPFRDTVRVSLIAMHSTKARILAVEDADVPRTPVITELEGRSLTVECGRDSLGVELNLEGPPIQTVEMDDLEMALHGCTRAGEVVRCGMTATTRWEEQNLRLSGKTWAALREGAHVQASRVGVGGYWAEGPLSQAGNRLLPGVETTVGVVFEGVPEGVAAFRFLTLDFYGKEAQFRDVPIGR